MPLNNFFNRISKLQAFDIAKETADIINENGPFIAGLLKRQLQKGKDGLGQVLTLKRHGGIFDYYSDRTVFEKERKGQPTDRITYYDSGSFYTSIYAYASGSSFVLDSDVPYFLDIELHSGSGEQMMWLDKQSLKELHDIIILPQLKLRFQTKVTNV